MNSTLKASVMSHSAVVSLLLISSVLAFMVSGGASFVISGYEYGRLVVVSHFNQVLTWITTDSIPFVVNFVKANQFVQVLLFGSFSAYAYIVVNLFYRTLVLPLFTGFSSTVTIHNTDPSYDVIVDYLSDVLIKKDVKGSQFSLQANTKKKPRTYKDWVNEYLGAGSKKKESLVYRPDSDQIIHRFPYKGKTIYLERSKSNTPITKSANGDRGSESFLEECLRLTVWGSSNEVLKELLNEALEYSIQEHNLNDNVRIYTLGSSWFSTWELALTKKCRPRDSVILDEKHMDALLTDAKKFLSSGQWYMDLGIPYRRGYLLYGPPGCGKTSFAQVLAGELRYDLCIMNLSHRGLDDSSIAGYLRDAPLRSIIVLEDIDALFVNRSSNSSSKQGAKSDSCQVSFSGLLNALDGIASQEGRILFMTTNHVEKLDPALIRPGRCDVQIELKLASAFQMKQMFLRFLPQHPTEATQFASQLPENEVSMAKLQGYFLKYSAEGPGACLKNISRELVRESVGSSELDSEPAMLSIFEHLKRVGLHKAYTSLFESHFISNDEEFYSQLTQMDEVLKWSLSLRHDTAAQSILKRLISGDKEFLQSSYSLAEPVEIREAFLSTFLSNQKSLQPKLTEDELHDLSHEFSSILTTVKQKSSTQRTEVHTSLISRLMLQHLLQTHPKRPLRCIEAARVFAAEDHNACVQVSDAKLMTLDKFLKRATLTHQHEKIVSKGVHSVEKLEGPMEILNQKLPAKVESIQKRLELSIEEAQLLAEIVYTENTERSYLMDFGCPNILRIRQIFLNFYRNNTESDTSSDTKTNLEDLAYDFSIVLTSDPQEAGTTTESLVGDWVSKVSTLEITKHLRNYPNDPHGAVSSCRQLLVIALAPCEASNETKHDKTDSKSHNSKEDHESNIGDVKATKPEGGGSIEWIDRWLRGEIDNGDRNVEQDFSQYSENFKKEGFVEEKDFIGSLLTLKELEESIGIKKLSHRRQLQRRLKCLIMNRSAEDKTDDCSTAGVEGNGTAARCSESSTGEEENYVEQKCE